jgi:regulator of replication initiation timing
MFTVFGEPTSKNTLEGLIGYLNDERNNNIRLSIIGKLDALETQDVKNIKETIKENTIINVDPNVEFLKRLEQIESLSKQTLEKNNELVEKNVELALQNEELQKKLKVLEEQSHSMTNDVSVNIKKQSGRPKKEKGFQLPE